MALDPVRSIRVAPPADFRLILSYINQAPAWTDRERHLPPAITGGMPTHRAPKAQARRVPSWAALAEEGRRNLPGKQAPGNFGRQCRRLEGGVGGVAPEGLHGPVRGLLSSPRGRGKLDIAEQREKRGRPRNGPCSGRVLGLRLSQEDVWRSCGPIVKRCGPVPRSTAAGSGLRKLLPHPASVAGGQHAPPPPEAAPSRHVHG
jgi:hypothetical protein